MEAAGVVDLGSLEGCLGVDAVVVGVRVPKGKTIHDCIEHISRNEASAMQGCKL